ncbi:Vitamin K epoxide reductase [Oscillochloris trichoides DG-6]|uniref:Vitamin K epoxide reductase n=1 Tax=Oscillochloris trichoides DG-6 TaxID=765420 RepID=E1II45_9CHLR|nr:vitamin K epoxide reductase family protein [Oscillochloris trichoides]EFO79163.1 Vitamin K epoxide reductase [Oscillochloris trichoides DG-6]
MVHLPHRRLLSLFSLLGLMLALVGIRSTQAQEVAAHAVLFFSPSCPHCHIVIDQVLPPLQERYGNQLQILMVDSSQSDGQALYQEAVRTFAISQDRQGVPALVFGNEVLVGSGEIPSRLPGLIVQTLAAGGNSWPAIPGLEPWIANQGTASTSPVAQSPFKRDPLGNSLAVTMLLVMIGSVVAVLVRAKPPFKPTLEPWRVRAIPILALVGIAVASYLAFVEVTGSDAVCGPVGDCNTVQQSPYAKLFGILPIGVLGVIGYIAILIAWALRNRPQPLGGQAIKAIPIMAFLGTIFSIYLTYLEPFVIGATCMWCLTSAVIITALLWIALPETAPQVQRGKGRAVKQNHPS